MIPGYLDAVAAWVVALAAAACMAVPAANLLAPALIKTPADLGGVCRVTVARSLPVLGLRGPRRVAGEPAEHWAVGIHWAALPSVVILQAKIAPWDGASPAVKASLYSLGFVTNQLRSLRARASRRCWRS